MRTDNFKTDTIVKITGGRGNPIKFETWKYWEIVGELISRGAERFKAYDTAKWAMHAERGEKTTIRPDILLKIK